ncbi:MAG: hypothetical protein WCI18_13455 [Pseudomonadota bacterium]
MRKIMIPVLVGSALSAGCGKKDKKKVDDTVSQLNNALAIGYPEGLSIPSFPQTVGTNLRLADDDKGQTLAQKVEDAKAILNGSADDCFANLTKRGLKAEPVEGLEKCYEFDQEMIYGYRDSVDKLYGTTNGLSRKTGSTEVCMVSFARDQMKVIERRIDEALDRAQVMACLAKKEGKELPSAAGQQLDITDLMNAKKPKSDANAPTFESVVLKRLDDVDSRPVFETNIKATRNGKAEELVILHSPAATDNNETYNGVISIKRPESDKTGALSIEYARSSTDGVKSIKASVRRGNFASSYTTLFDENGRVNYADLPDSADNSTVNGMMQVEFDMNQSDSTGTLSYWKNPGAGINEAARGFVFKVDKDATTSRLKGCAISGAVGGTSIRKALKAGTALKPDGWYHPFFQGSTASSDTAYDYTGTNPTAFWKKPSLASSSQAVTFVTNQTGGMVSRQCFSQDESGNYAIDTGSGIAGTAGYELIQVTDSKFIAPPPLDGATGKKLK